MRPSARGGLLSLAVAGLLAYAAVLALAGEQGELETARLWFERARLAAPSWPLPRYRLVDLPSAEATARP